MEDPQFSAHHRALRHETLGLGDGLVGAPPPRTVTPPGAYALSLDRSLDLGGFVFKDGKSLLHNDGGFYHNNTALGLDALISATPGVPDYFYGSGNTALGSLALRDTTTGAQNTAVGSNALTLNTEGVRNTAAGAYALLFNTVGSRNTAVGFNALVLNTSGYSNTAVGSYALEFNASGGSNTATGVAALEHSTTGSNNTAMGRSALQYNTTGEMNIAIGVNTLLNSTVGSRNIAVGYRAGFLVQGSDNIHIGSTGSSADSNTLRIGFSTGTDDFMLNRSFIAGIRGITTGSYNAINVLIDSAGQLGTVSSSRRFKEDIHDMGEASAGLAELRPVTFRYRKAFENGEKPIRYGLIAEEVAEVFPDLVAYDAEGRPEAILDHLLVPMLLNELQKQQRVSADQARTIARLEASLELLLQRREVSNRSHVKRASRLPAGERRRLARRSAARSSWAALGPGSACTHASIAGVDPGGER